MKLIEFKQVRFGNEEVIGDIIPPEKLFEDYENITSIPLRSIKISEEEFCSKFIEALRKLFLKPGIKVSIILFFIQVAMIAGCYPGP